MGRMVGGKTGAPLQGPFYIQVVGTSVNVQDQTFRLPPGEIVATNETYTWEIPIAIPATASGTVFLNYRVVGPDVFGPPIGQPGQLAIQLSPLYGAISQRDGFSPLPWPAGGYRVLAIGNDPGNSIINPGSSIRVTNDPGNLLPDDWRHNVSLGEEKLPGELLGPVGIGGILFGFDSRNAGPNQPLEFRVFDPCDQPLDGTVRLMTAATPTVIADRTAYVRTNIPSQIFVHDPNNFWVEFQNTSPEGTPNWQPGDYTLLVIAKAPDTPGFASPAFWQFDDVAVVSPNQPVPRNGIVRYNLRIVANPIGPDRMPVAGEIQLIPHKRLDAQTHITVPLSNPAQGADPLAGQRIPVTFYPNRSAAADWLLYR